MQEDVVIVPTIRGLNDAFAFTDQPLQTTRRSKNMRTQEPRSGRMRVGKRAGYARFHPERLLKNFIAYGEDPSRCDANGIPPSEGWKIGNAVGITFEKDGTVAPDGKTEVVILRQNSGQAAVQILSQTISKRAHSDGAPADMRSNGAEVVTIQGLGQDLVFSVFLKAGESGQNIVTLRQSATASGVDGLPIMSFRVTWTAGVPSLTSLAANGSTSFAFASEGNGWYRVFAKMTWDEAEEGTSDVLTIEFTPRSAGTGNATPEGTYFWGAQLEAGTPLPTTYQPVVGRNDLEFGLRARALVALDHIQRRTEYTPVIDLEDARSQHGTPLSRPVYAVALDRQGNHYFMDGAATLIKATSSGEEIFRIALPLADQNHVCRALLVDDKFGIYVGVSQGGDQATAKLMKFRQGPKVGPGGDLTDQSFHLLWEIVLGKYVGALGINESQLYVGTNDPIKKKSEVLIYDAVDLTTPIEKRRIRVSHPLYGLAVKPDGSVITTAPSDTLRNIEVSQNSLTFPTAEGWRPPDWPDWKAKSRTWLNSRWLQGFDARTEELFAEGDEVSTWLDLSGNDRNVGRVVYLTKTVTQNPGTLLTPPTVRLDGLGGYPTVHFDGVSNALASLRNQGSDDSGAKQQRTLLPSNPAGKFTMFVVFRPAYGERATDRGCIIGQENGASGTERALCVNRFPGDASNPAPFGGYVEGDEASMVTWFDDTTGTADPATGNQGHPTEKKVKTSPLVTINAVVVCIKCDDGNDTSVFRVNGEQIEGPYSSKAFKGTNPTGLGFLVEREDLGFYNGEICEVIVIDDLLSTADMELFEGYCANEWGFQNRLLSTHPYFADFTSNPLSKCPVLAGKADPNGLNSKDTVLAKFRASGDLIAIATNYKGVGYDVAVDPSGNIFTIGELSSTAYIRKVLDSGSAFDLSGLYAHGAENMFIDSGVPHTEDFDNAYWTKTDIVGIPNVANPPFGTPNTADQATDGAAGGAGTVTRTFGPATSYTALIAGQPYVFSCYLKGNTSSIGALELNQGGTLFTRCQVVFATGAISMTSAGAGEHFADIESIGAGWYRLYVTMTYDPLVNSGNMVATIIPDTTATQKSAFLWGAQLERARFPTPYRPGDTADWRQEGSPVAGFGRREILNAPRLAVDTFGNLYVCGVQRDQGTTKVLFSLRVYDKDLILLHHIEFGDFALGTFLPTYSVAVDKFPPDYTKISPGIIRNLSLFTESGFEGANGFWFPVGTTAVTQNNTAAPDGTFTADLVQDTSGAAISGFFHDFATPPLVDGEDYTFSIYIRPSTTFMSRIFVAHTITPDGTALDIDWNTTPPTFTRVDSGTGTHKIFFSEERNGFWRVAVATTYSATKGALRCEVLPSSDAVGSTNAAWIWGVQLEHGSDGPSTYQPVVGSTLFAPSGDDLMDLEISDFALLGCDSRSPVTEDFTVTAWVKTNVTVAGNVSVEPLDPQTLLPLTADSLTPTAANGVIYRDFLKSTRRSDGSALLQNGKDYSFSVYLSTSLAALSETKISMSGGTRHTTATLNHTTGAVTITSAGSGTHTATAVRVDPTYFLVTVTMTYDESDGTGDIRCQIKPDASGTTNLRSAWGALFTGVPEATVATQKLVEERPTGLIPRRSEAIAIVQGSIISLDAFLPNQIPRGGSSVLDGAARYVSAVAHYQRLFAVDGMRAVVYDPLRTGIVQPFKATKGEFPERVELLTSWHGRLLAARNPWDAHAWFASAIENPFDWDYFTEPLTSDKAVFSGTSRAGLAPDIINTLIPYDDEFLVIGCDHALWYLRGDPLAGGNWQLISDITGTHYGQGSWCKDPEGALYFFGSRGGVYRASRGGEVEWITKNTIDRRLAAIDLDHHYVEMRWNWKADGINIYVIPFGAGGTILRHYFWGRKNDEWREDEFSLTDQQPLASTIFDGGLASDRNLVFASERGYVLTWDENAKLDDGQVINSEEMIGPLHVRGRRIRAMGLEVVLASSLNGCDFSFFRSKEPETTGDPVALGHLIPGRNGRKLRRARGDYFWLLLSNSTADQAVPDESFAFEEGKMLVAAAGRPRQ